MNYDEFTTKQAGEIVQSFISISRILTSFTAQNAKSLGLTLQQMGVLNVITAYPEITLKAITDKLKLPKSTVSTTIQDLVDLKLVTRKTFSENRREIHLTSTEEGKALSKKSSENALSYKAMLFALKQMPKDHIDIIMQTHKELLKHLNNFNR